MAEKDLRERLGLEKRLKAESERLLGYCKNQEAARAVLADVLNIKGQLSIVPVEIEIPVNDVMKRYPISGSMEIVRTKRAIFLHSTCFWVISKPTLANNGKGGALYEMLQWYCDYQDCRDDEKIISPDKRDGFDTVAAMVVNVLTLPLDAFTDMTYTEDGEEHSFFMDVAQYIVEKRGEYYAKMAEIAAKENPGTAEDDKAILEMAEQLEADEEIRRGLEGVLNDKGKGRAS